MRHIRAHSRAPNTQAGRHRPTRATGEGEATHRRVEKAHFSLGAYKGESEKVDSAIFQRKRAISPPSKKAVGTDTFCAPIDGSVGVSGSKNVIF